MTVEYLFDLLEKVESRIDRYWNFYTVIVLALAGWLFAAGKVITRAEAPLVALGLIVYFLANFGVITLAESRAIAIESEIETRAQELDLKSPMFKQRLKHLSYPHRRVFTAILHGIVDVSVIVLLFVKSSA